MLTSLLRSKISLSIWENNAGESVRHSERKKKAAVEMDSSIFHEQGHLSVTRKSPSSLHQFNKDSK